MEKKWYVGIDISKLTLDVAIFDLLNDCNEDNHLRIPNTDEGFKLLVKWFERKSLALTDLLICMEHTGIYSYLIRVFFEKKCVMYSMQSPLEIKRSLGITRGKNDKIDAFRIAKYCYIHRDFIKPSKMPSEVLLKLQRLSSEKKRYIKQLVGYRQSLSEKSEYESISTVDRTNKMMKETESIIHEIEKEMEELICSDMSIKKNYDLLLSIVGIGMVNAITTIVNTENFTSFQNARQYACYVSVAPFEHSSGSSIHGQTRVSKNGDKQAKADLSQAAKSAATWDKEMKRYFERKKEQGKPYGKIMNAIKFKLIERMFAVINRGTPFVRLQTYA